MKEDEPLVSSNPGIDCSRKSKLKQPWNVGGCFSQENFSNVSLIQTMSTKCNTYVYCSTFNLSYMGVLTDCGQNFFRLIRDENWKAGPVEYKVTTAVITANMSLTADLTEIVNERLYPDLHHSDLIRWAREKIEENLKMDTSTPKEGLVKEEKKSFFTWQVELGIFGILKVSISTCDG